MLDSDWPIQDEFRLNAGFSLANSLHQPIVTASIRVITEREVRLSPWQYINLIIADGHAAARKTS
jgi:hypothetical protein